MSSDTPTVRWGVLSTANIGLKRVTPAIQASSNGEVVAIASRNEDRAQQAANQLGIPTAYGSYNALLRDENIDAIYIPLPNSLHKVWAINCAKAGKPVLCEKPLAKDTLDAQEMVDAFAERNVLFAEAFMYRFHPQTQKVLSLVDDGAIGELQLINASFTFPVRDEANIRLSETLAGGALMDVGCYCVNVMRLVTGEEPDEVGAIGVFDDVDQWLVGMLGFPSGVLGHFDCSLRTHKTHRYELRGDEGRIVVEEGFVPDADQDTVIKYWRGGTYQEYLIPAANSYQLMVEDFADALLNNRPPSFDPEDGVSNMAIIDALLASATLGDDDDDDGEE